MAFIRFAQESKVFTRIIQKEKEVREAWAAN